MDCVSCDEPPDRSAGWPVQVKRYDTLRANPVVYEIFGGSIFVSN